MDPITQGLRETVGIFQFLAEKRAAFRGYPKNIVWDFVRAKAEFLGITDVVLMDQEFNSILKDPN